MSENPGFAVLRRLGFVPAVISLRAARLGGDEAGRGLKVCGGGFVPSKTRGAAPAGGGGGGGGSDEGGGADGGSGGGVGEVVNRRLNGRVHLTVRAGHVPTMDPDDAAHLIRMGGSGGSGAGGALMPARLVGSAAKRREYPPSQINLAGLAVDSQFDELHRRQRALDGTLGVVKGVSHRGGAGVTVAAAVARVLDRRSSEGVRRLAAGDRTVWDGDE